MKAWHVLLVLGLSCPFLCCGGCGLLMMISGARSSVSRYRPPPQVQHKSKSFFEQDDDTQAAVLLPHAKKLVSAYLTHPDTAVWLSPIDGGPVNRAVYETRRRGTRLVIFGRVQSRNAYGVPSTAAWSVEYAGAFPVAVEVAGRRQELVKMQTETPVIE